MKELYDKVGEDVAREARRASQRWNNSSDKDDIEQELWVWILESPSIQKYLRNGEPAEVAKALIQKSDYICSQALHDYEFHSGQHTYTPRDVRDLLDIYYGTDVHNVSQPVLELAESELSETMISNILGGKINPEEKVDLEAGLDRLYEVNEEYHEILVKAFALGQEIGHPQYKSRAVSKLCDLMNRSSSKNKRDRAEGPGTKPKVTNPEY